MLQGQDSTDSIRVRGRSFLILADSSIYIERDTVLVFPDSIAARLKRDDTKRSEEFYQNLKEKFYKKRFTKELYNLLFSGNQGTSQAGPVTNGSYDQYKGMPIDKIVIKKLEVFGSDINDTTQFLDNWPTNVANDLHIYTRSYVIKNNLFFREGDRVDPDLLSDSERILRNLPYIKDARIYVIPQKEPPGKVDVLVVVKDIWSILVEMNYTSLRNLDFGITDRNFLGLGQQFRNELLYDVKYEPELGYSGTYTINNIQRSFITGEVNYTRSGPLNRTRIRFFRNFITPEILYAGGIDLSLNNVLQERIYPDTTIVFYTKYNEQDLWLGRSWILSEEREKGRLNLHLSIGYNKQKYFDRPFVSSDTNQFFSNHDLFLYSVRISRRKYVKSNLILGYGRTEDIPTGYLLEFISGNERNEFGRRTYLGWRFSFGRYFEKLGYMRPELEFGGFSNNGDIEQGTIRANINYFTYLYRINKFDFRQFFTFNYIIGINRYEGEFVDINQENGVRGLSSNLLRGDRKLSFTSETIAFTPYHPAGFRFAVFAFADFGIINTGGNRLFSNRLYQGYGFGFRLRNENLALNTIQIRLAFYPVVPPGSAHFGLDLRDQTQLRIPDFGIFKPSVISFDD